MASFSPTATDAKNLLQASELPSEQLADVWDRSDLNRDGKLDVEEWTVACQLVRLLKQGKYKSSDWAKMSKNK